MNKKIIIIGGGITGLLTGIRLLKEKCEVLIIEKNGQLGGKLNIQYPFLIYNISVFNDLLREINLPLNALNIYENTNLENSFSEFSKLLYDNSIDDDKEIKCFLKQIKLKFDNKKIAKQYTNITIKDYILKYNSNIIKQKLRCILPNEMSAEALINYLSLYFKKEIVYLNNEFLTQIINIYKLLGGKYLLNKEVKNIDFINKNKVENIILNDESIIEGDYYISTIDTNYTLNNLLNNKFKNILSLMYNDFIDKKIDNRLILMFAINKKFEYNNISININYQKINISTPYYITFKKTNNNDFIICEINQNHDDYDYLKIIKNKQKTYEQNLKNIIQNIINIFNNNFKNYKIKFKNIITPHDIETTYNSYRGMMSGFIQTPKNKKLYCECKIKKLKNFLLCSPILLFDGGITNSLIISKKCVSTLKEEIKNEKKEKI